MLFVDNLNVTQPQLNLALEEYLLRQVQVAEPLLLFYVNEPSVIIGRNQNTLEEIDADYVEANGVHVVRRLSGGGAVYHDLGNLNFSFVTNGRDDLHNFAKFIEPVAQVLRQLGVPVELRGSDIFAAGKKVSGNAQYASSQRMFSHGTLLFDTDVEQMLKVLNPRQLQIESKAVQSVRNFVTNIRELLAEDMTVEQLKGQLLAGIFGGGVVPRYELTAHDWQLVGRLAEERYRLWEWNIGRSPQFNISKNGQVPAGKFDIRIEVAEGLLRGIRIYGTFAGSQEVVALEQQLVGVRYERKALTAVLQQINLTHYLGQIELSQFLDILY